MIQISEPLHNEKRTYSIASVHDTPTLAPQVEPAQVAWAIILLAQKIAPSVQE